MKPLSSFFLVAVFCTAGVLFLSCWKDKTIKDKGFEDIHLNMSPTYGVPVMDLTIKGDDVARRINRDSATNSFYVAYQGIHDLCVITYDKTNIRVSLPSPPRVDSNMVVDYQLDFFSDLRKQDGWEPLEAYIMLYVDNYCTRDLKCRMDALDYENNSGSKQSAIASGLLPKEGDIGAAAVTGTPKRTLPATIDRLRVSDPNDIVFHGKEAMLTFNIRTADNNPFPADGRLNLNPRIEVPVHIKLKNFTRRDTVAASLDEIVKYADGKALSAKKVTMYLKIINALPFDADLQIYFADENHNLLDSIDMKTIFVERGIADAATFLVKETKTTNKEISMTTEQLKRLKGTKYLIVKEVFTSWDSSLSDFKAVKLFKSNYMNVILSVKVDAIMDGTISDIKEEMSNYDKK